LKLEVYQFVCESDVKMRAKRTTCARQNILDWIVSLTFDLESYFRIFLIQVFEFSGHKVHVKPKAKQSKAKDV